MADNNESGLVMRGTVRGTGLSKTSQKPFVQVEVFQGGQANLYRVSVKTNGQKYGDKFQAMVSPSVMDGKFYGFREL